VVIDTIVETHAALSIDAPRIARAVAIELAPVRAHPVREVSVRPETTLFAIVVVVAPLPEQTIDIASTTARHEYEHGDCRHDPHVGKATVEDVLDASLSTTRAAVCDTGGMRERGEQRIARPDRDTGGIRERL
jgi:hypothetical protein